MEGKIRLKHQMKFRKEKGYLLLCNRKSLETYNLPMKFLEKISSLKEWTNKNTINDDLLKDLEEIGALESSSQN